MILRLKNRKIYIPNKKTTTVHFCETTKDGVLAFHDNGVLGLLGLFGGVGNPMSSYSLDEKYAKHIRDGEILSVDGVAYARIDMIINKFDYDSILPTLNEFLSQNSIRVMIHEQYFYEDYKLYQPDFEEKLALVFETLCKNGYKSAFFEEPI